MDISIIIPALNEAAKIKYDILAAAAFIRRRFSSGEVIVIDDGSDDDTASVAQAVVVEEPVVLHVIRYPQNRGKGFAVRTGIQTSRGDWVMFADSGLCIPYDNAMLGLNQLQNNDCQLAHGSRKREDSFIEQQHLKTRRLPSILLPLFLRWYMGIPRYLTDTQCGFKIYNGDIARELYNAAIVDGFMFDVEIIVRALRRGYTICEFPVTWSADPDTRLQISRMPMQMLKELHRIKHELHLPPLCRLLGRKQKIKK